MITDKRKQDISIRNDHIDIDFESEFFKNKAKYVNIKCKKCGSNSTRSVSSLSTSRVECDDCILLKIKEEFEKQNLIFLSKLEKGRYLLQCRHCGYFFTRQYGAINFEVKCINCVYNNVVAILNKHNCKYLRSFTERETRVVYLTQDKEENVVSLKQILSQNFRKINIDKNLYSVYFFHNLVEGNDKLLDGFYFKVGIAVNPKRRLEVLKLDFPCKIYILKSDKRRKEARSIEKEFHNTFKIFKLSKSIAQSFTNRISMGRDKKTMKRYYMKDGSTEWFFMPKDIYDLMMLNKDQLLLETNSFLKGIDNA